MIRVLLVDDHAIVRFGLARLLANEPDVVIAGEAAEPTTALELVATTAPDVALVDVTLGNLDGGAALNSFSRLTWRLSDSGSTRSRSGTSMSSSW